MTALGDHLRQVHVEAAGLLELLVVQRSDVPALVRQAAAGSATAFETLRLVNEAVRGIQDTPPKRPMLCGSCPRALRNGKYAVIIARPACGDPTKGVTLAICTKCGPTRGAIRAAALIALRRIWPNTRPVEITHPTSGHA